MLTLIIDYSHNIEIMGKSCANYKHWIGKAYQCLCSNAAHNYGVLIFNTLHQMFFKS